MLATKQTLRDVRTALARPHPQTYEDALAENRELRDLLRHMSVSHRTIMGGLLVERAHRLAAEAHVRS